MERKAYFDSALEESKEIKVALERLSKIDSERLSNKDRGLKTKIAVILKNNFSFPPRQVQRLHSQRDAGGRQARIQD